MCLLPFAVPSVLCVSFALQFDTNNNTDSGNSGGGGGYNTVGWCLKYMLFDDSMLMKPVLWLKKPHAPIFCLSCCLPFVFLFDVFDCYCYNSGLLFHTKPTN